ncbi:MAG TPA: YbhB/YbcL family Raf kinase inhibitor-like protein [Candidatus Thermoplasmatota archaeon]|nr:YbhB/YbcL family Raf kinase inhibitor-like protein [Candidatus Thermoplasmatota archaeon]
MKAPRVPFAIAAATVLLALPLAGCAGVSMQGVDTAPKQIVVASSAFEEGASIPARYTCQGDDVSPPLSFRNVPGAARALALVMDDPDAPGGTFTHWLAWNIPATKAAIAGDEDLSRFARLGANDFGKIGYGGPCPPSGTHRYVFKVYATRELLDLPTGASRDALLEALEGRVLARGELVGTYAKR